MKRLISIFLLIVFCFSLAACSAGEDASNMDDNTNVIVGVVENEGKNFNNYKNYTVVEAAKEDWFSQIGYYHGNDTLGGNPYYKYSLGFNKDTMSGYMLPDSIVFTNIDDNTPVFKLSKEEYAYDIYALMKAVLNNMDITGDVYEKNMQDLFYYTTEDKENVETKFGEVFGDKLGNELVKEFSEYHEDAIKDGFQDTFSKFIGQNVTNNNRVDRDAVNVYANLFYIVDEPAVPLYHCLKITDDDQYNVFFVYDELQANVSIKALDEPANDGSIYSTEFLFVSDVTNQELVGNEVKIRVP